MEEDKAADKITLSKHWRVESRSEPFFSGGPVQLSASADRIYSIYNGELNTYDLES